VLASTDVDVMKGKQVSRILLNKDAVVVSRLTAEDGTVLRETRIDSSLLEYDVPARRLTVPRPGTMLVRDHRPPAEKVAGKTQAPEDQDGLDSTRGATAFRWADALDYNGAEHMAKLNGDVVVAYKPDDAKEAPVRLRAKEVVAIFEDAPKDAPKPGAAAPAAGTSKDAADVNMPKVRLRSVRAEGDVMVNRDGDELVAPRLTFDPITHWIRAVGTPQNPAVYTQAGRAGTTTAREFHWNTQTWKMRIIDAAGRTAAGR
jgi:hypothetical protein